MKRIEESMRTGLVTEDLSDLDIEITSFPVAVAILSILKNEGWLRRRYATAEAKRAYYSLLKVSSSELPEMVASFGWKIKMPKSPIDGVNYSFALHFTDYLVNAAELRGEGWRLISHPLVNGFVYLTPNQLARLMSAAFERRILTRVAEREGDRTSEQLSKVANTVLNRVGVYRKPIKIEQGPPLLESFPPCMKKMYESLKLGGKLSHIGRFALTSFLGSIGFSVEKILELFKSASDFDEKKTTYQVRHILGGRSGRVYTPPSCATLKTHGLCCGSDTLCGGAHHPLLYYQRKNSEKKRS